MPLLFARFFSNLLKIHHLTTNLYNIHQYKRYILEYKEMFRQQWRVALFCIRKEYFGYSFFFHITYKEQIKGNKKIKSSKKGRNFFKKKSLPITVILAACVFSFLFWRIFLKNALEIMRGRKNNFNYLYF